MMPRTFSYRGYSLDEIRSMDLKQFAEIAPARIRRSILRLLNGKRVEPEEKRLLERIEEARRLVDEGKRQPRIRTHCRDFPIIPQMIGLTIEVYNGKEFIPVHVRPEMLGHYLGEFALTRKPVEHGERGLGATRSKAAPKK
ncbi:MAG: 30S ribosomal protein S19 [Candidatus Diapherotrites archaeon]|nr:30S ribosomal protein S19 [Candidatus Diapherotrites archaeon]